MLRRLTLTLAVTALAFFSVPGVASASTGEDNCVRVLGWAACF